MDDEVTCPTCGASGFHKGGTVDRTSEVSVTVGERFIDPAKLAEALKKALRDDRRGGRRG